MRPMIFTAIAVSALVASVAIAQPAPPPPPGGPGAPHEMDGPGGPRGYGGDFMRGRHMMPPPPKAAFFRFRKGDASVTVKCADDEPTKACTDAATAMLQAINATPAR